MISASPGGSSAPPVLQNAEKETGTRTKWDDGGSFHDFLIFFSSTSRENRRAEESGFLTLPVFSALGKGKVKYSLLITLLISRGPAAN